jgi:hypothetical protein
MGDFESGDADDVESRLFESGAGRKAKTKTSSEAVATFHHKN